jgi:photosystem II stability/assembly factor-like uncharacterized protein
LSTLSPDFFKMKKKLLFLIAGLAFFEANAQWESLNGPTGDGVTGMVKTGNDLLLSTYNGVFRSSDDGEHWQIENNALRGLSVHGLCQQKDTIYAYAGTGDNLFRSTNEGHTWLPIATANLDVYVFHQMIATDSALFITDPTLQRSFDGGMSWEHLSFPTTLQYYYTRMIVEGNTLYVVAPDQGIFKSEDQGDTWILLTGNLPKKPYYGFVHDSCLIVGYYSNGWKTYRSFNEGATWTLDQTPGLGLSMTIFGGEGPYIYSVSSGELRRTSMDNNLWSQISDETQTPFLGQSNVPIVHRIKFYAFDNQLFATSYAGVHRSSDHGENWQDIENGLVNIGARDILLQGKTVVCAGNSGLYRLPSQGQWSGDLTNEFSFYDNEVLRLSEVEGKLYAGSKWKLFSSADTGQSWQAASPFLIDYLTQVIKVGNDLLSGSSQGVWRSADNGTTWVHSSEGMGYMDIDVFVYPFVWSLAAIGNTVLAAGYNMLYRSVDGGNHWDTLFNGYTGLRVYNFENQLFWVTSYNTYRSNDAGATWQPVVFDHPDGVNSMARLDSLMFASTRGGVLVSKDEGYTWSFSDGNFPDSLWISCLSVDNQYLYAGTQGEGVWRRPVQDFTSKSIQAPPQTLANAVLLKNPVTECADIRVVLPQKSKLEILVFNAEGRLLRTMPLGEKNAGEHIISVDLTGLPQAIYKVALLINKQNFALNVIKV